MKYWYTNFSMNGIERHFYGLTEKAVHDASQFFADSPVTCTEMEIELPYIQVPHEQAHNVLGLNAVKSDDDCIYYTRAELIDQAKIAIEPFVYIVGHCYYPALNRDVCYRTLGLTESAIRALNPEASRFEFTTETIDPERPIIEVITNRRDWRYMNHTDEFVFVGEPMGETIGLRYLTIPKLLVVASCWWTAQQAKNARGAK